MRKLYVIALMHSIHFIFKVIPRKRIDDALEERTLLLLEQKYSQLQIVKNLEKWRNSYISRNCV